jgi:predicted HTH transcriptional regulator
VKITQGDTELIRLKIFISSVQKELREERTAIGRFLVMDDFLRECTVPRIFEDYPQPLRPNPKAYLDLLQQCQIYLLIIGTEYGSDAGGGLSATHEEYRLAQKRKIPTLICVKGADKDREKKEADFFTEIRNDKHTYSRFTSIKSLLEKVGERLREHIAVTYDIVPRKEQVEQSKLTERAASDYERGELSTLSWDDLDHYLAQEMMAAAEGQDKERIDDTELPRLLFSRGYLWKDAQADVLRPTIAGALLLARNPSVVLSQSRVQMDVYAGVDQTNDPIDSVFIAAPLPYAVEQAVAFIRRNTAHPLVVKGMKRQDVEVYPSEALRELIVNALAHRDYADPGEAGING